MHRHAAMRTGPCFARSDRALEGQVLLNRACRPSDLPIARVGSRSTPLRDIEGSVHRLRLKQQAARFPDLSFESVFSIRIARVSQFLVESIHRIQSQRATRVMSIHNLRACGSDANASAKSAGTFGSGHSASGSSATDTESPTSALAVLSMVLLTLNQWLPIPSGSSGT
jgi:hypothetical protein